MATARNFALGEITRYRYQFRKGGPIVECVQSHTWNFCELLENAQSATIKKTVEGKTGKKMPTIPIPAMMTPRVNQNQRRGPESTIVGGGRSDDLSLSALIGSIE
jgi:hypothetical protein